MIENSRPNEIEPESRGVSRRTVMRTAAWTAPVVSVAAAAPAYASSTSATLTASTLQTITVDQRPIPDPIVSNLTLNGSSAPDGSVVTYSTTASWLTLTDPLDVSNTGSSVAIATSGGAATVRVASTAKPAIGASTTVLAQYVDSDSVTHSVTFTLTYVPTLKVVRVGDGTASLTNAATAVFIDEYATTGGAVLSTLAMPTAASGANVPVTLSGTATSEGELTLSADRKQLALTGYDATPGTTGPSAGSIGNSTSATTPRVVALVDAAGSVDSRTLLGSQFSGNNPRAVAAKGASLWAVGGNSGVVYTVDGETTSASAISTSTSNIRAIGIFDGNLYFCTSSGTKGVYQVGSGLPTTAGQAAAFVAGAGSSSPYGFVLLARNGASCDTLYVADDSLGLLKFSLEGGTWTARGAFAGPIRGITGYVDGSTGSAVLFATVGGSAAAGGGSLYKIIDAAAFNATISATATTLATAAGSTAFRGVAFCPDA